MEQWLPLLDYPIYSASSLGRVRNDKRDQILKPSRLQTNHTYVSLFKDGTQHKRSVAKIVSETFLPIPKHPSFNTPIHFDGDLSNCQVRNMDWRPRWFAMKHSAQFHRDLIEVTTPVREIKSREVFENPWEAVFRFGILYMDLIVSIHNKTYVFPTMQSYEWA